MVEIFNMSAQTFYGVSEMTKNLQEEKERRQWLKLEWEDLWIKKHEDAMVGEEMSSNNYTLLDIKR